MWKWLQHLVQGADAPAPAGTKPAPVRPDKLDELLAQALPPEGSEEHRLEPIQLRDHLAGRIILGMEGPDQAKLAVDAVRRLADLYLGAARTAHVQNLLRALSGLSGQLLGWNLPFTEEQLLELARAMRRMGPRFAGELPLEGLLDAFEGHIRERGLGAALLAALETLPEVLEGTESERRRVRERLRHLLQYGRPRAAGLELRGGDAWSSSLLRELDAVPDAAAAAWWGLVAHCAKASSARPSPKWLSRARELASGLEPDEVCRILVLCLGRIGEPGERRWSGNPGQQPDPTLLNEEQADLLRGLVWCAGLGDDPALAAALGDAADACFRKVRGHGPRNAKVGNACVDTLSRLGTPAAVGQLSRLRSRVRHRSALRQIEAALGKAAERQGLTTAELEELSVPTLGLTTPGLLRQDLGGFTAELRVTGTSSTELAWLTPGGKPQKSVPKAVKEGHAEELKALTAASREIQKLLPAQRDRLERLYLHPRDWDLGAWRERYLDHPLVGTLARRLIWRFGTRTGCWHEDRIVDAEGRPLDLPEEARVSLWHPLDSPADEVLAWRIALEAWEVVQPFKQAHREIYLLTEAELGTGTYSNRFAAHVLKQHQFAALCRQRGWTYSLQGAFDSGNTPTLALPEHGLQVEFWVDGGAGETSDMGIYLHISTDQVRFCDLYGEPRLLPRVPRLLFSELMRDVDLFVGVCSVGNDPNWADNGERPELGYWREFSFGQLGESARTRRELLSRLVPRLKIADRCTLTDRFLVVRGDLRTYKIHLGSGNILMAPNDQYLCIVADRSQSAERTVLPFEGDGILALILSKAFLLAEDTRINDPQILSQIGK